MKNTKDLTIGAMFGAIYGVLLLFIRYLFPSTDSLIYYFIPLPLAIYTYWKGFKNGLILMAVCIALGFLICDPYRAALLLTPNFVIGYIFGILKNKPTIILLVMTFITSLIANFLSIYAFEVISQVSYLEYMSLDFAFITDISNISADFISKLVALILPIVLIIDALMKTIILYLVFIILAKRLKLAINPFVIKITFNYWVSFAYTVVFALTIWYLSSGKFDAGGLWQWIGIVLLSCFFVYSFYLLYLGVLGLNYFYFQRSRYRLVVTLLMVLLMPVGIILGIVFGFMKHNNSLILKG